MVNRSYYPER